MRKFPRILFFIAGSMPTADDFEHADELGPNVAFRNGEKVPAEGSLEHCDGVAGKDVPKRYADAFPVAKEAIEKWMDSERAKRAARAANEPEPQEQIEQPAAPVVPPVNAKPQPAGKAAAWKPNAA